MELHRIGTDCSFGLAVKSCAEYGSHLAQSIERRREAQSGSETFMLLNCFSIFESSSVLQQLLSL